MKWWVITAIAEGPPNGGCPASSSCRTHPRLKMSLRPSVSRPPLACSGLMYVTVPRVMPVSVSVASVASPLWRSVERAMPKSATSAWPWESSTFSGLMSR